MGTGQENDNCVGLKLAKTLALHLVPLCAGRRIGPFVFVFGREAHGLTPVLLLRGDIVCQLLIGGAELMSTIKYTPPSHSLFLSYSPFFQMQAQNTLLKHAMTT